MGMAVEELRTAIRLKVGGRGLVQIADDLSEVELAVEGSSVSAPMLLQTLGHMVDDEQDTPVWAMLLVEPLARLLFAGSFSELVLLARWPGAVDLFPNWPPPVWATCVPRESYVPTPSTISVASLTGLVSDLRRWYAVLPREDGEEDGPGSEQQLLERPAGMGNLATSSLV